MTKTLLAAALLAAAAAAFGAEKLPAPDTAAPFPLAQALAERHSTRAFDPKPIAADHLSYILWAGGGINRPDGRKTVPSALNRQEIALFALRADGAARYDAAPHALVPVTKMDLRPLAAAKQDFVRGAPLVVVIAADMSRMPEGERSARMAAIDAGHASQSMLLACTALGLACVPRATMDAAALQAALGLPARTQPLFNVVIGHPKR